MLCFQSKIQLQMNLEMVVEILVTSSLCEPIYATMILRTMFRLEIPEGATISEQHVFYIYYKMIQLSVVLITVALFFVFVMTDRIKKRGIKKKRPVLGKIIVRHTVEEIDKKDKYKQIGSIPETEENKRYKGKFFAFRYTNF